MAQMFPIPTKDLVIPRGIMLLGQHPNLNPTVPVAALRDVGNVPSLTVAFETDKVTHRSSRGALREIDDDTVMEVRRTGQFETDSMTDENVAMLFFGDVVTRVQASALTAVEQTFNAIVKGSVYQLGVDLALRPLGHRSVTVTTVTPAPTGTAFVADVDYTVDTPRGLIRVMEAGAIADGANIKVTYDVAQHSQKIIASGVTERAFTLRFVSQTPKGPKRDYYMPFVRVTPNGDFGIQSEEDYQKMSFSLQALPLGNLAAIYVDGMPYV